MPSYLDNLQFVQPGQPIRTREMNLLIRAAKSFRNTPNSYSFTNNTATRQTIQEEGLLSYTSSEVFEEGEVIEIYQPYDPTPPIGDEPLLAGRTYIGTGNPERLIGIVEVANPTADDWGLVRTQGIVKRALVTGSPNVGEIVGPFHNQTKLERNQPGFQIIGQIEGFYTVRQLDTVCYGHGTTAEGSTGTPATISLQSVEFESGINCWDQTTDFVVDNTFADELCDNQTVYFMWSVSAKKFVATNVLCCP